VLCRGLEKNGRVGAWHGHAKAALTCRGRMHVEMQFVAGSVLCGTSRRIPEWKILFSISFSKRKHSEAESDSSKAFVPGLFLTACRVTFT